MDKTEVLRLANLARIKLSDAEAEKLSGEFEAILKYVGEVQAITPEEPKLTPAAFPNRNVMREDGEGHETGLYTEKLLKEAPAAEDGLVRVKKIL